jgi:chemotaxis protein CheX
MKMDLIQPFVSSLDAVLAETLSTSVSISDVAMDEDGYRKKGPAMLISIKGQIEGRIILDMDTATAARIASVMSGEEVQESDPVIRETVAELANMVIGNAVTLLNDRGFTFKVFPPEVLTAEQLEKAGADTEATVLSFHAPQGDVYMNIMMRYLRRRSRERTLVGAP